MADRFESPPDEVALHRDPDGFGDDKTKPRHFARINLADIDNRVLGGNSKTPTHQASIVLGPNEPIGSGQHVAKLRGQFDASLAATRAEDGAAGAGAHSQTKSVHLGAAPVVGLKSSLAHNPCLHALELRKAIPKRSIGSQGSEG